MTTYKTVVNWLAFLCLAFLSWEILRDFAWGIFSSLSDFIRKGTIAFSNGIPASHFLYGSLAVIIALAIIVPWLRLWSVRFRCLNSGMWITESFAEKINAAGRWILAAVCLSLVPWLCREDFLWRFLWHS
jgi:hypothetical protein